MPLVMSHCLRTKKLQKKTKAMMLARRTGGLSPVNKAYKITTNKIMIVDKDCFTRKKRNGKSTVKTTIPTLKPLIAMKWIMPVFIKLSIVSFERSTLVPNNMLLINGALLLKVCV